MVGGMTAVAVALPTISALRGNVGTASANRANPVRRFAFVEASRKAQIG
jgi:hypothetical protein